MEEWRIEHGHIFLEVMCTSRIELGPLAFPSGQDHSTSSRILSSKHWGGNRPSRSFGSLALQTMLICLHSTFPTEPEGLLRRRESGQQCR